MLEISSDYSLVLLPFRFGNALFIELSKGFESDLEMLSI